jgi:hypothetical protein
MAQQGAQDGKPAQAIPSDDKEHGEGNYAASKQYNDATKQFVESGKVEDAARQAKPKDANEARDLEQAEAEGRSHAKEEDPQLQKGGKGGAGEGQSQKGGRP